MKTQYLFNIKNQLNIQFSLFFLLQLRFELNS